MECFYSVIVPVYNTASYLRHCVNSVQKQSFANWELILIDDGSTDGSEVICDELVGLDSRIKAFHKPNGGAASARNIGIHAATGKYILFLDSDDYFADEGFFELLSEYEEDVVCVNYVRPAAKKNGNDVPIMKSVDVGKNRNEAFDALVCAGIYTSSACLKRVLRKQLLENDLFFDTESLCEDIEWNGRLACCAQSFAYEPKALYAYRVRTGSTTQTIDQRNIDDMFTATHTLEVNAPAKQSELFYKAYMGYVAFQFCCLLINISLVDKSHLKNNLASCEKLKHLLKHAKCAPARFVKVVSGVFGLRICSRLLLYYYKSKQ